MATPPSSQKKRAKKQQRRSLQDSPGKGNHWVQHPSKHHLLVPSSKQGRYQSNDETAEFSPSESPGGLVDPEQRTLYARLTAMQNVDIGVHIPVRSDSILIHPLSMEACGIAIATPVLIENTHKQSENITENVAVCRAWPIAGIPLDVVALGPTPLLSMKSTKEGLVKISPLPNLSPPVAGHVDLESREPADVELMCSRSFQNFLLHMHSGYYVCEGSYLSVQYFGEERVLQIRQISSLESTDSSSLASNALSPIKEDLPEKFSNLSLATASPPPDESQTVQNKKDTSSAPETSPSLQVYKITAKTKLSIHSVDSHPDTAASKVAGPTLASFAGDQKQVQLLKELVLYPLENPQTCQNLSFPHGVLLYGPPGIGKSLLAHALSNETPAHSIHLSASELLLGNQNSEGKIQEVFSEARKCSPTLIVLDDLHLLCPHRNTSPSEAERKSTAALITCLDSLLHKPSPAHIVIIATTNQIERVEPSLRRPGRFDREVEMGVPSAGMRREILRAHLRRTENDITEEQLTTLADSAHGYVGADLHAVCADAQHKALHRSLSCESGEGVRGVVVVGVKDVRDALREIGPSAMREVAIEVPKVHWRDIGGQEKVKQRMREAVEWPLKYPETFLRLGVRPPRGVLLFGPPGCSKTMVARALATESGLNFIAVKGPELFSKWVGDSERAVRQVFSRARAAAPAIIFFDEIDALAVQRKSEGSSVADRVLAQLLTEMDGVETLSDVLVVAATNRPDMIDKALLRPGRIDRMIYVPLPDDITRKQILEIQFRKTSVGEDVNVDSLVAKTRGYSGAEVVSLCQEAALCAMHEDITCSHVSQRHFSQAFETVQPQTDQTTIEFYEKYNK